MPALDQPGSTFATVSMGPIASRAFNRREPETFTARSARAASNAAMSR